MAEWVDGKVDGWIGRGVGGEMSRWVDRQIGEQIGG